MKPYQLGEMEKKFADMLWEKAPIATREVVKLCEAAFGWKRTTAYTMLKRLCDRNLFVNTGGMVTALMPKEDFQAAQGEQFINETFDGSLPQFLVAFCRRRKLGKREIVELKKFIEGYEDDKEGGSL